MDYDEEDSGASGIIPEFGAIFMSNFETKKECFKRKMFALPSSKAEFVKHIKTGMVLFLFEVKKRQLFGVYEASSDGAIDICPHAFNYSGKRFPAQVCITSIWDCSPLSEEVFHDAISENYFSPNKFNLGLSEHQVRSLLFLFSSRKLNNKRPSCHLSEAVVGVADKDRRYMELEYEEFNSAAFYDHHENSSARAKDDVVLVDDGLNIEGEVLPYYPEEDCFGKRRKLVYQDRSITNIVSGRRMYNHGTIWTFQDDSPKDSLDELRLANDRRFLPVEKVNENRVAKKLNHPLDVRAIDDYRFTQSRLLHEYDMHNVSRQTFASDCYRTSLDKTKHAIDDDTFLIDDFVQRDYASHDTVKPVACNGSNQNLCRQARGVLTEDHEHLINGNLLHRYYLDRDDSPIGTLEQSANLLHKSRKTAAARRPAINKGEPDFAKCSWGNFSSGYLSRPLQRDYSIIFDKKYPIEEGRFIENMVDNNFCSDSLAKDAEYPVSVEHRLVDDRRFRKNGRADNEEGSHMHNNPAILMDYPSFSRLEQNMPSFSDKLPEKGLNQPTVSHNFDLSRSTFDDALIARVVPYSPRHPIFSHGFSASIPSNLNPSLVQRNNGSLGSFHSPCQSRLPRCSLKLEKSSTPLDIASEFGNKDFPTSTSGCRRSMIHEPTSSFVNSNLPVHMNLNTYSPINYQGSLFPKLSPQHTDPENIGGQGLFAYPSKSRDYQFKSDGNLLTPSLDMEKEVLWHEMGMLAGKNFSCSQAKDLSMGICHPERDLASPKNQYIRKSSTTNSKELHKDSEAPHANSSVKRSVFTRLTLKEESHVGREGIDIAFKHDSFCLDATADEVMEMLPQNGNLSKRKFRKSRFGGQPTHGEKVVIETTSENALSEKKTQNHIKTNHSTMEKDKLNEASLATADSIDEDEVPKETRIVDFKRRSDRKKIGITFDSDTHNTVNFANEEVKSSTKTTLKRKKLVRPNFTKIDMPIKCR